MDAGGVKLRRLLGETGASEAEVEKIDERGAAWMTCFPRDYGGAVAVSGETGTNFGAGMTGGFAYVLDEKRDFVDRYNHELIDIHRLSVENTESQVQHLRVLLQDHVLETGSEWAQTILNDYRSFLKKFWIVKPKASALSSLLSTLRNAA